MYVRMMSACHYNCKSRVSVVLRQWALHCGTCCSSTGHSLDDVLVDGVGSRSGLCFCDGRFRRCSVPSLDYVLCSFDGHVCEVVGPQRCSFMYKTQGCTSPGNNHLRIAHFLRFSTVRPLACRLVDSHSSSLSGSDLGTTLRSTNDTDRTSTRPTTTSLPHNGFR